MYKEFFVKNKNLLTVTGLLVVFYFMFFHNIWSYPLMDIDETRYVLMSKDMYNNHDFLTLYLNGEYFFEKPPLYFWLECFAFKILGVINEFSARFPAALCAMIISFAVYFTGKKVVSQSFGVISSLVLAASLEFTMLAKYAILDIFLCTFVALSVLSFYMTLFVCDKNKKYFWWLFYIFSALAVLAKGVPGFVIPFGSAFFVSLLFGRLKECFKPVNLLVGLILFLLITLPWHIVMLKTHSEFFQEYIVKHHLQRFVNSKDLGRKQPWFYFLVTLIWGLVPWIASVFAVMIQKLRNIKIKKFVLPEDNSKKFLLANLVVSVFTLVFFSSSSTKLITYILPVYPFTAFVIGYIWIKYINEGYCTKAINISNYVFSFACVLCAVAAIFMQWFLPQDIYAIVKPIQIFAIPVIIFTHIPALIFCAKSNKKAVFACYVAFILFVSAFGTPIFYKMNYKFGQNDLMSFAKYAKDNSLTLYAVNTGRRFSLNYYGNSKQVMYLQDFDFEKLDALSTDKKSIVVIRKKEYEKYKKYVQHLKPITVGYKYVCLKRK